MNKFKILLLVSLILGTGIAKEYPEEDFVLVLTQDNFNDALKEYPQILVEFYAPWCGHCKQLVPEYARAAKTLREKGSRARLAKVDATKEKDLAQRFDVHGYPTIKWFDNGVPRAYEGGRTDKEFVNWVRIETEPFCKPLENSEMITKETTKGNIVLVYWGEEKEIDFALFEKLARMYRDYTWFYTNDASIKEKNIGSSKVQLSLYRNFEEPRVDFNREFSEVNLREFIDSNSKPIVALFSQFYAKKIFGDRVQDALLLFHRKKDESSYVQLKQAGETLRKEILLVDINIDEDIGKKALNNFGLEDTQIPAIGLIHFSETKESQKYVMKGSDITSEKISKFFENYKNSKLQRFFKSEAVPEKNDGKVKIAVASTFREIVHDSRRDAAVILYAPWCKHCKDFLPIWEKIAERLSSAKDLIFVKIDATSNELENIEIKSYPTILFYPTSSKSNPIKFSEKRSEEAVLNWIKQHITISHDPQDFNSARNEL